jgi:methyl-accepting chemotaxis protein
MMASIIESDSTKLQNQLTWRTFRVALAWMFPCSWIAAYLVGIALGLDTDTTIKAVVTVLPPVLVTGGFFLPYFCLRALYRRALSDLPGDKPGDRLKRLMKLPYRAGFVSLQLPYLYGGVFFTSGVCVFFGPSNWLILLGVLIGLCFGVLLSFPVANKVEEWIQPLALKEQDRLVSYRPKDYGFFWPRQNWYLPYVFASSLLSAIILGGSMVVVTTLKLQSSTEKALNEKGLAAAATAVSDFSQSLLSELAPQLAGFGIFLLGVPTATAWMLARRQSRAAAKVQQAVEGLAMGRASPPGWISTDEIGDLAVGMYAVLERLKEIPAALKTSAEQLLIAGSTLSASNEEQSQSLSQQAAALHEAQVTSQEIQQTSLVAAERAESVLKAAARVETLGQQGEKAMEQSLAGLSAIRDFVDRIRERVTRLEHSAQQIGGITASVKDLADQSNMLALNAAIEAVRSGEHGKGFSVVAREIRSLSDQSIQATNSIRQVLEEITNAIRETATMSEVGARQVEAGFEQVKTSGTSLTELSALMRENSASVRQISAAVGQQHAGISQIFSAIKDLSRGMDDTMRRLNATQEAAQMLQTATRRVEEVAQSYQIQK